MDYRTDNNKDIVIIGGKDFKTYFKVLMRKLDSDSIAYASARGKNILTLIDIATYITDIKKEITISSVEMFKSRFMPKDGTHEKAVSELNLILKKQ